MYKISKSVPRGYEYLSPNYSRKRSNKGEILQDKPPALHTRTSRNYSNTSPLRNKQKLVEARTYRSPLNENTKNVQVSKLESIFKNLKALSVQFKSNQSKMQRQCKENIKRLKSLNKNN